MFTTLTITVIILLQVYVETMLEEHWHLESDTKSLTFCEHYEAIRNALNVHFENPVKGKGQLKYIENEMPSFYLYAVIRRIESPTQAVLISKNYEETVNYYCVDGIGHKNGVLTIEKIHKKSIMIDYSKDAKVIGATLAVAKLVAEAIVAARAYEVEMNSAGTGPVWDVLTSSQLTPIDFTTPCRKT